MWISSRKGYKSRTSYHRDAISDETNDEWIGENEEQKDRDS